jgi:hypothetical protein
MYMRSNPLTLTPVAWMDVEEWWGSLLLMPREQPSHRSSRPIRLTDWSDGPEFSVAISHQITAKNSRLRLYF